jgi:pimeloyl-ACP methyl ester carboxylesterase
MSLLPLFFGSSVKLISKLSAKRAQRWAYYGFAHPFKGRLMSTRLPAILEEAQGFRYASNKFSIQSYYWKNDGPVVLLAHGWESNASRWETLIRQLLQAGFSVVALDAPAHGLSNGALFSVPDYADAIEPLCRQFKPEYLIGHSMGAYTALYFLTQHEHPFKKVVCLGSPFSMDDILKQYTSVTGLGPSYIQHIHAQWNQRFGLDVATFHPTAWLEKINTPLVICHDQDDAVVPFSQFEKLKEKAQKAETVVTKGLGHSQQDAAFFEQIISLLR